jgi:DNA repair photolyase
MKRVLPMAAAFDPGRLVEPMDECGCVTVSPYAFCGFRCRYCITGAPGRAEPLGDATELIAQLQFALATVDPDLLVGFGAMRDAYPPVEAELGLTRALLVELRAQRRPVTIITKGTTVRRDIDLFLPEPRTQVTVSLCSLDTERLAELEPGVPSVAERLDLIEELVHAGVPTAVSVAPWIPGLTDALAIMDAVEARVGEWVWSVVSPLNVRSPLMLDERFVESWDQTVINEAYRQARVAAPFHPRMTWMDEVPIDGKHSRPGRIVQPASCPA